MKEQADVKFLLHTETLIKSVLTNCALVYEAIYDSSIKVSPLDQALLDLKLTGGIETANGYQPVWLAEYFGQDLEKLPEEVPFVGLTRRPEQLYFLNQLRELIRSYTYNFQHLEYLLPEKKSEEVAGEKKTNYIFRDDQQLPIYLGLVRPVLAAMEQREISQVQSKQKTEQTGQVPTAITQTPNPYQTLGSNILIKGTTGEFDQLLTYKQLQELLDQIKTLRAAGKSEAEIIQFLKTNLAALNIFVNDQGQIEIFLASHLKPGEKDRNLFSIDELSKLFDLRLGEETRGNILQHGRGNLALTTDSIGQQISANETAFFSGGEVYLDESGATGNHVYFFIGDREGSTSQVYASTSDLRTSPSAFTRFMIADRSRQIPLQVSPVRLATDHFPETIPDKTLRQIYSSAQPAPGYVPLAVVRLTPPAAFGPARTPEITPAIGLPQISATQTFQLPENIRIIGQPVTERKTTEKTEVTLPEEQIIAQPTAEGPSEEEQFQYQQYLQDQEAQQEEEETVAQAPAPKKKSNFFKAFAITGGAVGTTIGGTFLIHFLSGL